MRSGLKLGLVLLSLATAARAQTPVAVEAPAPAPTAVPTEPSATSFFDRFSLSIGLGTFSEAFPVSSMKVPDGSHGEFSVLAGARFWIGTQVPNWFRLLAVLEFGYTFGGTPPNHGADAISEGAGLEVTLEIFKRVKPFVRFIYDAVVFPLRTSTEGTLASNALIVSAGVRIYVVEFHLSIGQDFAGGISPGFGLSLSWLY